MRRLLVVGFGDIAQPMVPLTAGRRRVYALARDPRRFPLLRALGVTPVRGDLDRPDTLAPLAGIAHDVAHLAPLPERGARDTRTAHLIAALAKGGSLPQHLVYISTSGVYGDCGGALVAETRPPRVSRAASDRLRFPTVREGIHG